MPTYEYECGGCKHKFEAFQSMSALPIKRCPKCSKKVRRLIGSGAGIIFKGPGFYATDYRKPSKKEKEPKKDEGKPSDSCSSCVATPSDSPHAKNKS